MPNITLTVTASQASRIAAALSATDYPQTVAGYRQLLIDYTRSFVQEYERAQSQEAALATIPPPATLDIS